jgi:hypothetical protein
MTETDPQGRNAGGPKSQVAPGLLPDEERSGPPASSITDDLKRFVPHGWIYDGVMHLLPGVTLEEAQGGTWEFTGQIVDSAGQVLKEAKWDPEWDFEL